MEAETTLSQYESALIRAKTTAEILHAAFDLQLAARGDEGKISNFPYPSISEMGAWGAATLSNDLREKARKSLVRTPYAGWKISQPPLSAPLPLFANAEGGNEDLFINLHQRVSKFKVALRELHEPYSGRAADWRAKKDAGKDTGPKPISLACVIARGWLERQPIRVEPERRKDKTLLGIMRVSGGEPHPARQMGLDFGGRGSRTRSPSQLPVLAELNTGPHDVPILNMVDGAGLPVKAPNRGAPRALRFAVRTLAMVPTHARKPGQIIRMAISMRDCVF